MAAYGLYTHIQSNRIRSVLLLIGLFANGGIQIVGFGVFALFIGVAVLGPVIAAFPPAATVAWAEGLGQPTFTGSSGRIFPRALKASPLLRAWLARHAGHAAPDTLVRRLLDELGYDGLRRTPHREDRDMQHQATGGQDRRGEQAPVEQEVVLERRRQ